MQDEDLIRGIIYSEVDDALGPNPILWLPSDLPEDIKMHVSIKVVTLLTADQGRLPDSLVILPFPLLNLKGIIKYIEMKDETKRGGIYLTMITLLFHELNDVIFYKGMENFDNAFDDFAQRITKLKEFGAGRENIRAEVVQLRENILDILEDLKESEQHEAFPEEAIQPIEEEIHFQFKIIVVGDPTVGKTSLILRYTENAFRRTYISTLGVQVSHKIYRVNDKNIQLILWDLAGQAKFDVMRSAFYQGAKAVLIAFDLTNAASFLSIKNWYYDIMKHSELKYNLIGFVLGNKNDLISERVVSLTEATQLANIFKLGYFETSALTGENVDVAFNKLAETLLSSAIK